MMAMGFGVATGAGPGGFSVRARAVAEVEARKHIGEAGTDSGLTADILGAGAAQWQRWVWA